MDGNMVILVEMLYEPLALYYLNDKLQLVELAVVTMFHQIQYKVALLTYMVDVNRCPQYIRDCCLGLK